MGDISDYYRDIDEQYYSNPANAIHELIPSFKRWRMNDGNRILVTEMKTSHVINTINLIKRKAPWRAQWLEPLEQELKSR